MDFSVSETKTFISTIADLYKKGSNIEAEHKLMEIREAFLELKEENLELRTQLHAFREAQSVEQKLTFDEPFYYLIEGENAEGPYCQRCHDADGKLIRLIAKPRWDASHHCRECKESYGPGDGSSPF